jgi:hypothetical protein
VVSEIAHLSPIWAGIQHTEILRCDNCLLVLPLVRISRFRGTDGWILMSLSRELVLLPGLWRSQCVPNISAETTGSLMQVKR